MLLINTLSEKLPFKSVTKLARSKEGNLFTLLAPTDLYWPCVFDRSHSKVHANTLTVYFSNQHKDGLGKVYAGFVQLLESSVFGVHSAQLNVRIYNIGECVGGDNLWITAKLEKPQKKINGSELTYITENGVKLSINTETQAYSIDVALPELKLSLTVVNAAQVSYKVGTNGETYFGPQKRVVRHYFIPRCICSGNINIPATTKLTAKQISLEGHGQLIDAYQGLKPYLAANTWRFFNLQTATVGINLMEYQTPSKYGSETVTIAGLVDENTKLAEKFMLFLDEDISVTTPCNKKDPQSKWSYPADFSMKMKKSIAKKDGTTTIEVAVERTSTADLTLVNKYDVMGEVPDIVKALAGPLLKIKPYIFQFEDMYRVRISVDGVQVVEEVASGSFEASFIGSN
ncbi:hypothetical protein BABINDRAFT_161156 [Babjeviella inositovora NRRL Y-12698]|uniref:Svf1-like C-terminal domain-containing protein n=1 Tax=Babjeviella inositovora NRRL Y-12698 TaxID=984486 RepID=A0A1E3QRA5_9ASCO|nr:uncharacterized protein BABINDRAFT_161156 [Babjeviella inositovora NRRL Y-12698]ODQ80180.1 hypothetical protein BABINDRAFT_161156 [Babjeviella inositovora NRRL Y-12698]